MLRQPMPIDEISICVERRIHETVLGSLPTAYNDKHIFTFFGRIMPIEWFWEPLNLLPAIVVVGAQAMDSPMPKLRVQENAILGHVLDEEAVFEPELVDSAFAQVRHAPHHVYDPGSPDHLAEGCHIEITRLLLSTKFWAAAIEQGLKPVSPTPKLIKRLPTLFFDAPNGVAA